MSDTKLTYELDGSGRITVRATNEGVLLTKEESERVVAHIDELERSYAILQNHFDKTRQRWIMRGEHISKQRERIAELESLVRGMWEFGESSKYPYTPLESVRWAQMREELGERMTALGLLDGDAE